MLQAIKRSMLGPTDADLRYASPEQMEVALRRRAIRCRKYSWIFLFGILAALGVAANITLGLLASVGSVERAIVTDIERDTRSRLETAEAEIAKLSATIKQGSADLERYVHGIGLKWDDVTPKEVTSGRITEVARAPSGEILALEDGSKLTRIWRSTDAGQTWIAGQSIPGTDGFSAHFSFIGERLFIVGLRKGIDDDFIHYSDDLGATVVERPIKTTDPDCSRRGFSDFNLDTVVVGYQCMGKADAGFSLLDVASGESELLNLPPEPGAVQLLSIEKDGRISILTKSKDGHYLLLTFDRKTKAWERDEIARAASHVLRLEDRYLFVEADVQAVELKLSAWQRDQPATPPWVLSNGVPDKDVWKKMLETIAQGERGFFSPLNLNLQTIGAAHSLLHVSVEREKQRLAILLPTTGDLKDLAKVVEGIPFPTDGPFVIAPGQQGREIRRLNADTGAVVERFALPEALTGRILRASQKDGQWVLLVDSPLAGEKSIEVWSRRKDDPTWHKYHPHSDLNIGALFGGWETVFPTPDTALLVANQSDGGPRMIRTEPYDAPTEVFKSNPALLKFIKTDAPRSIEHWPPYRKFVENLAALVDLQRTGDQLRAQLNRMSKATSDTGSPAPVQTGDGRGITLELLIISFARFLVLAVVFFGAKILINLYRYFLRLSAFYEARADGLALILANNDSLSPHLPTALSDLFAAFSPDSLDLGAAPKTPVGEVADAAATLANAASQLAKKSS